MKAVLIVGLLLTQDPGADPNDAGKKAARDDDSLRQRALKMIQTVRKLGDWNQQSEYITDAVERMYERNGWDSESDLFALDLTYELTQIPPWSVQQRFDRFIDLVGERYLLDDEQEGKLRGMLIRNSIDMFRKHSSRIMEYGMDAIRTRAAGEPFTPEQVAHWTELARPVMLDARLTLNNSAREFMKDLDPEQQGLVRADLDSANRRINTIEHLSRAWMRGEWEPSQWGMEDDPIQTGALAAAAGDEAASVESQHELETGATNERDARTGTRRDAARRAKSAANLDNTKSAGATRERTPTPRQTPENRSDPWAEYVRRFIVKYALDEEQQQKAWLFHKDARQRADAAAHRFARKTGELKKGSAAASERTKAAIAEKAKARDHDLERLFSAMKRRLERLPTRAQRRAAEARPAKPTKHSKRNPGKP